MSEENTGTTNIESTSPNGSVEKGLSGDYELSIGSLFQDSWALIQGRKLTCVIAVILLIVSIGAINFVAEFVLELISPASQSGSPDASLQLEPSTGIAFVIQLIVLMVSTPINVGLTLLGIKLVSGQEAQPTSIFEYFPHTIKLFLLMVTMYILVFIGFLLLVIPGLYLGIAYIYAPALMVEKNMGIWEALETSRKTVTHKWFTVFFTVLLLLIVIFISSLPVLIGLIWTLPLAVMLTGLMYKQMFGIETTNAIQNI
ncbi:hypothetical protein [Agaribacterium sp. ZY112]|uniref:hypothetical protein n=1 Tax=Agaribacterium sp. ZY112 TaxID=3233574 RepID=UPI0035252F5A